MCDGLPNPVLQSRGLWAEGDSERKPQHVKLKETWREAETQITVECCFPASLSDSRHQTRAIRL